MRWFYLQLISSNDIKEEQYNNTSNGGIAGMQLGGDSPDSFYMFGYCSKNVQNRER